MNPDHQRLHALNRFALVRQLKYSQRNEKSLDMALFLNGLPLVTMELKNSLTGQVVTDAEKQYKEDRDPREPLFKIQALSGSLRRGQREGLHDDPLGGERNPILSV